MRFVTGDRIEIEHDGRTVNGLVLLASENGLSLMLEFEAVLHGHVGMMPVTMVDETTGRSIVDGIEVTIRRVERSS